MKVKYNVYRINEETGEILGVLLEGITDISPYKDGVYDKDGYFISLSKESSLELKGQLEAKEANAR